MPPTDPAAILLDFEHWATHRMLDACAGLTDDQLDREFEMGLGTLRRNLAHNIGAMIGWTCVLEGREPEFPPDAEDDPPSIDRLRAMHDEAMARFRAAGSDGYGDVLTPARNGTTYRFSRGGIVTHVVTHSMHHRAQCLNMLRHLGVETQPESSVFQWMLANPPG